MSDEIDKQNAEAEPMEVADKASAEADKPNSAADKPAETATAAPPQADKKISSGAKAAGKRSNVERALIGALVVAVLGVIWAGIHVLEVMKEAKDPLSQSGYRQNRNGEFIKSPSESELERDEQQFQPKNVQAIPQDSAVMHEQAKAASAKADAKARKSTSSK